MQQNQVDDRENRNVPIVDFVDIDHPALLDIRTSVGTGKSHGMPDERLA